MKTYKNIITLSKNGRGLLDLDVSKGCTSGLRHDDNGCYGDCYAARTAKRYGIDFSKTVLRGFISRSHIRQIIAEINNSDMPFIRIGCSGDPSENWNHTFDILRKIKSINKEIVIITRHWTKLTNSQLKELAGFNIVFNTSVSALDTIDQRENSINEYNRLKNYCKSCLRIVSCWFNLDNIQGRMLSKIQDGLFENDNVIDTVFRPSKNNLLVTDKVILVEQKRFINSKALVSKNNKKAYLGNCGNCIEKCGVFTDKLRTKDLPKQASLFN